MSEKSFELVDGGVKVTEAVTPAEDMVETLKEQVINLTNAMQHLTLAQRDLTSRMEATVDYTAGIIKLFQDGKMGVSAEEFIKAIADNKISRFDNNIKQLLQQGTLKRVSEVGPLSRIVSEESNLKTGDMMNYRLFLDMSEVKQEFKDLLLTKTVGDVIAFSGSEDNDGSSIKILDILEMVIDPPRIL